MRTSVLALAALCFSGMESRAEVRLVGDLNRGPGDFHAGVDWIHPLGQGVVFSMDTLGSGAEPWISDGTAKGTRQLKDINPGTGGSEPTQFVTVGHQVVFRASSTLGLDELWMTDGTEAETRKVFESPMAEGELHPLLGTQAGLYFNVSDWWEPEKTGLWFTDGTAEGTHCLNSLAEDGVTRTNFTAPHGLTQGATGCYFIANGEEIWRTDGTVAGTSKVATADEYAGELCGVVQAGERLFMATSLGAGKKIELWACNLIGGAMTHLRTLEMTAWDATHKLVAVGDRMYFREAKDGYLGRLWQSDGTPAGTHEVVLSAGGEVSTRWATIMAWNDTLYGVVTTSGVDGMELWRTDGTPAGTAKLTALSMVGDLSGGFQLQMAGGFLYFQRQVAFGVMELWRWDGATGSTRMVKRMKYDGTFAANGPQTAVTAGSELFLAAGRGTPENALWRTRNPRAGTMQLTRPEKASGGSFEVDFTVGEPYEMASGYLLAFVKQGPDAAPELWRMREDGRGPRAIWKALLPQNFRGAQGFRGKIGTKAVFTFWDGIGREQLWSTDGTPRGTHMLHEDMEATGGRHIAGYVEAGGSLYYYVTGGANAPRTDSLWKTDGTPEGTVQVVDAEGFSPAPRWDQKMVSFQGRLYFSAYEQTLGKSSLWCSDGTPAGTVRVKEDWNGVLGASPENLAVVGDRIAFMVRNGSSQTLWTSDGTAAGTVAIPAPVFSRFPMKLSFEFRGDYVFASAEQSQWWRSNGEVDGTQPVMEGVNWYHLFDMNQDDKRAAVAGDLLFYSGRAAVTYENELWVTDGTSDGSHRVKDISPPPYYWSDPQELTAAGRLVYFTAQDGTHGNELWRSDGTESGTVLVADIEPGEGNSSPRSLKVMNGRLYFTANRRSTGRELYSVDLEMGD